MTLTNSGTETVEPAVETTAGSRRHGRWQAIVLGGGVLGIISSGWQTVDRINWAAHQGTQQVCDINAQISCSTVLQHWQSSALGIPNSIVALPVFAVLASAGLAGLTGSVLSRRYLGLLLGISVFMTGFVTWYMEQTAFNIGVLCLFCLGCMASILIATVGVTRVAAAKGALGGGLAGKGLDLAVRSNVDLVIWATLAVIVAVMLVVGLN